MCIQKCTLGNKKKKKQQTKKPTFFSPPVPTQRWNTPSLEATWPLLHLKSQQKPRDTGRPCLSISESWHLLGNHNTHTHKNTCMHTRVRDTGEQQKTRWNPHLLLTLSTASQHRRTANTCSSKLPGRLMAHTLTHDNALISIFAPPLPSSSAGCADGAAWRNPLSRHFSFPLTDRPWRAQAFGPPAWLAARQLNKLSSCYNSLKHFQLPQSNISHRRALGCFSTSNPTPQRVLFPPIVWFIWRSPMLQWRGRVFLDKSEHERQWGEIGGYKLHGTDNREMILRFAFLGCFKTQRNCLCVLLTLLDRAFLCGFSSLEFQQLP